MAKCAHCRRNISSAEEKKQKVEYDEGGRLRAVYHLKCWFVAAKRVRFAEEGRTTVPDVYTASAAHLTRDDMTDEAHERRRLAEERYQELMALKVRAGDDPGLEDSHVEGGEVHLDELLHQAEQDLALARRQEELAADELAEPTPRAFTDWRDPTELEV